jgi:translation elongation factor EF-G
MEKIKEIKFVFIGHVDTGKSTLSGHLKYLCGKIDEHTFSQIKKKAIIEGKERMIWSNINDIFEEEMEKGKTHEYSNEIFDYRGVKYHMVDTPGHLSFIREMIEGVAQEIDIAVLMVSAIENEFESSFERGMLKEHTMIAKIYGIRNLIVIINKMDKVEWSETIFNKIKEKVMNFMKKISWNEHKITFIPLSAYDGIGIMDTKDMPKWYMNKSFFDTLNDIDIKPRKKPNLDEIINGNTFGVEMKIMDSSDILITQNFQFVLHYQSFNKDKYECHETIAEIKLMKDIETNKIKKIAKNYEAFNACVKTLSNINGFIGMKALMRKGETTIGFIIVNKIGTT